MAKKKSNRVAYLRYGIVGGIAVIAALVVGYGLLYSTGATQGEFVAGEHYQLLETPERSRPGAPIRVREFFSYGCVHCKNFDPLIDEWQESMPDGVEFSRVPVAFSPAWVLLSQTYYALEQLGILEENHPRIFRRIHDNRMMFANAEEVADYVDGHGTTAEEFLATLTGQEVRRKLREADTAQRAVGISSVPTLVVAGKYTVTMDLGRKVALEVVDHLLALEQGSAAGQSEDEGG